MSTAKIVGGYTDTIGTTIEGLSDVDQVIFDAAAADMVNDPEVRQAAVTLDETEFQAFFEKRYAAVLVARLERDRTHVNEFLQAPVESCEGCGRVGYCNCYDPNDPRNSELTRVTF